MRNACRIYLLGRSKRRWEDNIKTNLNEIMFHDVGCGQLIQYNVHYWAVVSAAMNLRLTYEGFRE
jgi:hypothetical protein